MDELIERMLPVGARLSPYDRASGIVHNLPVTAYALAIAFHVSLLEVGGETVHVLVVGKDRDRLGVKEIVVPDAKNSQNGGKILLQWRRSEMLIHCKRASQ